MTHKQRMKERSKVVDKLKENCGSIVSLSKLTRLSIGRVSSIFAELYVEGIIFKASSNDADQSDLCKVVWGLRS